MAGKSERPKLILSPEQKEELSRLSHSRRSPAREVQRAQILCRFEAGETITEIARALKISRPSVRKWVDKALAMGAAAALKDTWHRPHAPVITEEAKAVKATVQRILAAQELHPERVQYYLEKRDPEFESKMKDILLVYQEVALQNETRTDGAVPRVITVSVDEKPGLQ